MGMLAIRTHTRSLKKMASGATVDNCVIVRMGWGIGHIVHNIVASTITVISYSMVGVDGRSRLSFGLAASQFFLLWWLLFDGLLLAICKWRWCG